MPLLASNFAPPRLLRSPHIQTIVPALLRRPGSPSLELHSLETGDGDTLRYRLHKTGARRLAIVSHGLEGSFDSSYVHGISAALVRDKWDVLTWNMRGCGDMPNRLMTWYHSGKSDDLKAIIAHALTLSYQEIALIGFSVGGNITLKHLGEEGKLLSKTISCAVTISVPMDLQGSADALARPSNAIYMQYLLRPLRRRMLQKKQIFPTDFDLTGLSHIRSFHEFDRRFTAPFHGFRSVEEYWGSSSALKYLQDISVPTLAISALDDPFLSPSCFPHALAEQHPHLYLETPLHGGHVGFMSSFNLAVTWTEQRVLQFLREHSQLTNAPGDVG